MFLYESKKKCCGCGACEQSCASGCIKMKEDKEGFLYPVIDDKKCSNCGNCLSACPISNNIEDNDNERKPISFAAYNKDENIRIHSSSGGIFTCLASEIIKRGGIVFGAAYDEDWCAHDISVETIDDLSSLRGSKYMKNRTEDAYSRVQKELENGRDVLYTGTPCEIEGLNAFLGKEYDNLYLQDIICHGSPSPKIWRKYLSLREKKAGSKTDSVSFRNKSKGWKLFSVLISFRGGKTYCKDIENDLYMQLFLQDLILRPSCYDCRFKKENRVSDITLADFWGCENVCPQLDDNKGLSLVLVHSSKGERLLDAIKNDLVLERVDFDRARQGNVSLTRSCEEPAERESFMKEIDKSDLEALAKKYLEKQSLSTKLKNMLPVGVKRKLKQLIK